MLAVWMAGAVMAASGGFGVTSEMGAEPMRPVWGQRAAPQPLVGGAFQLWMTDRDPTKRAGFRVGAAGLGPGKPTVWDVGFGVGRQTRGRFYLTGHSTFGLTGYHISAGRSNWNSLGILVRPGAAIGLRATEFLAIEGGPTLHVGIPVVQTVHNEAPSGRWYGHATLGLTFLFGDYSDASLGW